MSDTEFVRAPIVLSAPQLRTPAEKTLGLPVLIGRWAAVLVASIGFLIIVPLVETVRIAWRRPID